MYTIQIINNSTMFERNVFLRSSFIRLIRLIWVSHLIYEIYLKYNPDDSNEYSIMGIKLN